MRAASQKTATARFSSSDTIAWQTAPRASLAQSSAAATRGAVRQNGWYRTSTASGGNCVSSAVSMWRARLAVESDRTCTIGLPSAARAGGEDALRRAGLIVLSDLRLFFL